MQLGGAKGGWGFAGERGPRMCLRWRGKAGAKSRDMNAPLSWGIDFPRWVSQWQTRRLPKLCWLRLLACLLGHEPGSGGVVSVTACQSNISSSWRLGLPVCERLPAPLTAQRGLCQDFRKQEVTTAIGNNLPPACLPSVFRRISREFCDPPDARRMSFEDSDNCSRLDYQRSSCKDGNRQRRSRWHRS